MADFARDADDTFAAQGRRLLEQFLGPIRRIEHRLRAAFAVADINEDEATEIAPGVNPAGKRDGLPDVSRAQFVAMVRAFHEIKSPKRMRMMAVKAEQLKLFSERVGLDCARKLN